MSAPRHNFPPLDGQARERLRASGLFDPAFYRDTYGPFPADCDDPLEHFLAVGMERGYLPSASFDPVLYKMLVPGCGDANPLLHYLASGEPFRPDPLKALFSAAGAARARGGKAEGSVKVDPDLKLERNRAYAKDATRIREMPFEAGGRRYSLQVPDPAAILDRLRNDRPFAFARLPHGFWDLLRQLESTEKAIAADDRAASLTSEERRALAERLCDARTPNASGFAPSFLDEVLADIPVHASNPAFFRSLSFVGFPTFREIAIGNRGAREQALKRLVAAHFRPDETLYDATYWKRLLIAGELRELPPLCRSRPVILVASDHFSDMKARWQLERFTHLRIPRSRSQWQRRALLERVRGAVADACLAGGPAPVVIMQCGASLAYWLITRLFSEFPRVFYLDLGQAIVGWFFDKPEIRVYRWMRVYTRTVIEHCRLEPYYRALKGSQYDEWYRGLP